MASPQPTDSHTRISNDLYTQILMRDFTKRQRSLLDLIIRLSYGCGKKTASIPQIKHFGVCGIRPNKVGIELINLHGLNVIDWDNFTHEYWMIKDYDSWLLKPPDLEQNGLFNELLRINLSHLSTSQNGTQNSQNGTPKSQNGTSQNGNQYSQNGTQIDPKTGGEEIPKREVEGSKKPITPSDEGSSITNIITNDNKELSDVDLFRDYQLPIMKCGHDLFGGVGLTQKITYDVAELLFNERLPVDIAFEAIRVTKELNRDEGFITIKVRRWLQRGVKDAESARKMDEETFSQPTTDELVSQGSKGSTSKNQRDERYSAFYQLFPDS